MIRLYIYINMKHLPVAKETVVRSLPSIGRGPRDGLPKQRASGQFSLTEDGWISQTWCPWLATRCLEGQGFPQPRAIPNV